VPPFTAKLAPELIVVVLVDVNVPPVTEMDPLSVVVEELKLPEVTDTVPPLLTVVVLLLLV
jgi:hypothetical protein